MRYSPHEYQRFVIDYIKKNPVAAVFLDMGLGKTSITLTALNDLLFDSFDVHRILVVAPLRVARNTWSSEIKKWEHLQDLQYSIVVGTEKERMSALEKRADIYIINRENVQWLVEKSGKKFDYDMVVVDELSSFKNHEAKRFRAFMKVRPKVKRIVGLTGTPSSNGLMDLFAEFKLLDMGERLGRYITGYRERFFVPDKRNKEIIYSYKLRPGAEQKIYSLISDICISMKAHDYLQMPERIDTRVEVAMSDKEQKFYDQLESDMVLTVGEDELDAVNAAALSNKLSQMANGAVYDENKKVLPIHDRKLDALEDLIEAANGKPVLVAYWFKHDKDRIKRRFDVREIDTAKDIADWNEGKIPVALIHPASAGHGLNLQDGGSNIIWFGLTWSLELYQQLNARLWRQGQQNTVVVQHLITKGTVDEDVMKALERKDAGQSALIDAVRARIGGRENESRRSA